MTALTPDEAIALAHVLDRLSDGYVSVLLADAEAWANYQTGRAKVSHAAEDAVHASRASRRYPEAHEPATVDDSDLGGRIGDSRRELRDRVQLDEPALPAAPAVPTDHAHVDDLLGDLPAPRRALARKPRIDLAAGVFVTRALSRPAQRALEEWLAAHQGELDELLVPHGLDSVSIEVPVFRRVVWVS